MGKIKYSKIYNKSRDDVIMTSLFEVHPCVRVYYRCKFGDDPNLDKH